MKHNTMMEWLKWILGALMIFSLVSFSSCATSSDDDDNGGGSGSDTLTVVFTEDGTVTGTLTEDATAEFGYDPAIIYSYDTANDEYNLYFAKNYDINNSITYQGDLSHFDHYSTVFLVSFKGTPMTGDITDSSADANFWVDGLIYSPDGTTDIYMATDVDMTITKPGENVGDVFAATINSLTLWLWMDDLSGPKDGGTTKRNATSGSFSVTREEDDI